MDGLKAVQAAQKGSIEAFTSLIRANEPFMYGIARSILKSDPDAGDAIQETIIKAYNSISKLREPNYFRTWLTRILINECRQIVRRNSKLVPVKDVIEPEGTRNIYDSSMEMEDLLDGLDPEHKEVIVLYYWEDISIREIAQMLDISEGTVKSRLYRARMKLAVLLKNDEEEAL
ncbi:RNA polymerase sigma factor [Paenibacillus tarimensis]